MALTILEGSTFCICDELGDITEKTGGFFAEDTRYLSLFRLTVNGQTPLLLSSGKVEHSSAAFYLRNPLADGLPQDSVAIVRERFVSDAMQERITVENVTGQPVSFELAVQVANDFADIFAVKEYDFALGDPTRAKPLPTPADPRLEDDRLVLDDREGTDRGIVAVHVMRILMVMAVIMVGMVMMAVPVMVVIVVMVVTMMRIVPPSTSPGLENATWVRAFSSESSSTSCAWSASKTGVAGSGSGLACAGSPSAKSYSLTAKMSAKSLATWIASSNATGSGVTFSTTIRSCIASDTKRSRTIATESCARPSTGAFRR